MSRGKVQLQRITDDKTRQEVFHRHKQALFRRAMELSVLCDCDVGLIVFAPGSSGPGTGGQRLYQFSSIEMDDLLERYAGAVNEPHERRGNSELMRHYYELSPDEDGEGEEPGLGLEGDADGAGTSAAAAAAAATMAAVDSVILGSGRRQASRDGGGAAGGGGGGGGGVSAMLKRMVPAGVPGGLPGQLQGGSGLPGMLGMLPSGLSSGGLHGSGLTPGGGGGGLQLPTPGGGGGAGAGAGGGGLPGGLLPGGMRRVGGGAVPLEGIKAAGFLDKRNYPVSPRSERAYEDITAEFDKLTELRNKKAKSGSMPQTVPTGLQPLSSSSLTPQQHLTQLLLQHQQQHLQHSMQLGSGGGGSGGNNRFKPLSIMVPDNQAHPILQSGVTPLTGPTSGSGGVAGATPGLASTAAGGRGGGPAGLASSSGAAQAVNGHFMPHLQQHGPAHGQGLGQGQGGQGQGLPPRAPSTSGRPFGGRTSLSGIASALAAAQQAHAAAAAAGGGAAAAAAGGGGAGASGGAAPMDTDGGGSAFTFDRRTLTGAVDDLGPSFGPMRMSIDGSAAAMLSMPSPPPHGATAAALFGALDGGPLSVRSSSHGMLAGLGGGPSSLLGGLERGASLGLSGLLESPGPMALDASLRGLAPMDVLDWPSSSPRSSAGNSEGGAGGGAATGGFSSDDGEGGTVLDGLEVRGTALSKLAPEARVAAIGSSPPDGGGADAGAGAGGGGTPSAKPASSGGAGSAFAAANAKAAAASAAAAAGVGSEGASGTRLAAEAQGADAAAAAASGRPDASFARATSYELFAANVAGAADGLMSELSFNVLSGAKAAAAAAAVAAAQLQREAAEKKATEEGRAAEEAEGSGGEGGSGEVADLGLMVVGKALEIPAGASGTPPPAGGQN
ncbi:hypothetical protein HYH02_006576 [Chlamydomonas schloesseri]|uniref:MADS-box domain-containing protein n=1 Tax=Chlamydomonas schloesseri TaxID=2026947 RepID=A0A835W6E5_9CHLO|nr:hypothetical protein HYH02_006576 [Chlamydomonas schloesseri]|eukprot:KAG2439048.1 hypothetical protein HYH02_006576 [Chlamydomonas schloesseri]